MAHRAGVQAVEIAARHGPNSDPHRTGVTKLADRASHHGLIVRRHQPGVPGIFPLRRCSRPLTCPHSGACGTLPCACCSTRSPALLALMTSFWPRQTSIAASQTPDDEEDRMSAIPCGANLTPMGCHHSRCRPRRAIQNTARRCSRPSARCAIRPTGRGSAGGRKRRWRKDIAINSRHCGERTAITTARVWHARSLRPTSSAPTCHSAPITHTLS
jgi:hypothetical protein